MFLEESKTEFKRDLERDLKKDLKSDLKRALTGTKRDFSPALGASTTCFQGKG